jgi:hypothetical protein
LKGFIFLLTGYKGDRSELHLAFCVGDGVTSLSAYYCQSIGSVTKDIPHFKRLSNEIHCFDILLVIAMMTMASALVVNFQMLTSAL